MKGLVTSDDTMFEIQGDKVLVFRGRIKTPLVMTVIRVGSHDTYQLRLVNREVKRKDAVREDWPLKQHMLDAFSDAGPNKFDAKWELTLSPA